MYKRGCFLAVAVAFCVAWGSSLLAADVFAVENQAEKLYGEGVHAFFDGDYAKTVNLLKQVERLGSEDPRPYFYLGLAYSRLGMEADAKATLKEAAAFEWVGQSTRDYGVSDALRRIQGIERLYVEAFRSKAKMNWEKSEMKRRQELYGKEKASDNSVIKAMTKGSDLPPPPKQIPFVGTAPHGASSVHPFKGAEGTEEHVIQDDGEPKPTPPPAPKKKVDADDDEKADEPKKEDMKADGEDPFGAADSEKKADEPKKDEKKADEEEDPFGMSDSEKKADDPKKEAKKADDDEDPFGAADSEKKADEPKKDEKKADDDEDPFGMSDTEKKADDPKKEAKKADDDTDPFGASDTEKKADEPKKDEKKEEKKADDDDDPFK